jgi:3-methyladenine DNA glycosylase AlkC
MAKSKNSFKEDFQKHPVLFTMVFAALFIVAVVILFMNLGSVSEIWPTDSAINSKKKELADIQKKLQKKLNEVDKLEQDEYSFIKHNADFWINQRDGDAKINIQKRINGVAARHKVTLSSVGAVRSNKIKDGIYLMATTIRGEGSLKSISNFLGELQSVQPRFYWQTIMLRPKSNKEPSNIMVTGAIQVIAVDDEEIIKLLMEKR